MTFLFSFTSILALNHGLCVHAFAVNYGGPCGICRLLVSNLILANCIQKMPRCDLCGLYYTYIHVYFAACLEFSAIALHRPRICTGSLIFVQLDLFQGLVVPVLRNVENMNYAQIEKGIEELGVKVCFIHKKK